jgi:hypothetical protein
MDGKPASVAPAEASSTSSRLLSAFAGYCPLEHLASAKGGDGACWDSDQLTGADVFDFAGWTLARIEGAKAGQRQLLSCA